MEYLLFSEQDILERVDEYALYCHYLKFQPVIGGKTAAPDGLRLAMGLKHDNSPSFGIYTRKYGPGFHEFLWKDQAAGIHGDVFDLVKTMYRYRDRHDALLKVMADFGLGGTAPASDVADLTVIPERKYSEPVDLSVKSRPFTLRDLLYWKQFHITQELLQYYNVTAIGCYWITLKQTAPDYPRGIGFAYRIWDKYQFYFPYAEKRFRFRHDWAEAYIPGHCQLQYDQPMLIITKSYKDVMCLRSFGYEAVAPRGESVVLPQLAINYYKKRYSKILVLFDNDMKHKGDAYEFPKVYIPRTLRADDKDASDFCSHHGYEPTAEMLSQLFSI